MSAVPIRQLETSRPMRRMLFGQQALSHRHELCAWHVQSGGDFQDSCKRRHVLPSFDLAQVASFQTGLMGQCFLGNPDTSPGGTHG